MAGQSKKTADLTDIEALKAQIIEEAKAEARRIIAEAKKSIEPEPAPETDRIYDEGEEYVTVRLPLMKNEGAKFVAVNGENILIPRGKDVRIKKKFYWVLQQSEEQNETAMRLIQGLSDDYSEKSTQY